MPNQRNNKRAEVGLGWTWIWLKAFWGSEKVKKWQDQIVSTRGDDHVMNTEQIHNLMTLSIQVQHYWDSAICAFRPIRVNEEKTSMEIAFHWLPLPLTEVNRAELVPTQKQPYPDQRQGFGYSPREDGPMFLFHRETR